MHSVVQAQRNFATAKAQRGAGDSGTRLALWRGSTPNGAGPFPCLESAWAGEELWGVRQHTMESVEKAVAENRRACVLGNNLVRGSCALDSLGLIRSASSLTVVCQIVAVLDWGLPGPDAGGMGPRQWPFSFVKGWSSLGHHTVNSPLVRRTSTRCRAITMWVAVCV